MKFVDFTGTTLLDLQGVRRDVLSGTFTAEELANRVVEEWIPYLECDQCGKASYCRFTKPSPYVSGQLAEIRCGVAEKALHNFVNSTFHLLEEADTTRLQDYLDGLHYFCRFVYETELLIGSFISDGIIGWYGEYAPALLVS
jgi:hypothetical protein